MRIIEQKYTKSNLDKILNDFNENFPELFRSTYRLWEGGGCLTAPSFRLFENDLNYELVADLPGYQKSEVEISIEGKYLIVKGSNKTRGEFHREILLWEGVDKDKVSAKLENGELKILVGKVETVKPKVVKVE